MPAGATRVALRASDNVISSGAVRRWLDPLQQQIDAAVMEPDAAKAAKMIADLAADPEAFFNALDSSGFREQLENTVYASMASGMAREGSQREPGGLGMRAAQEQTPKPCGRLRQLSSSAQAERRALCVFDLVLTYNREFGMDWTQWVANLVTTLIASGVFGAIAWWNWNRVNDKVDKQDTEINRLKQESLSELSADIESLGSKVDQHIASDKSAEILNEIKHLNGTLANNSNKLDRALEQIASHTAKIEANERFLNNVNESFQRHKGAKHED